jgi:predicted transposase YbfD/YdcC
VRSVIEITREVTILRGKDAGKHTIETVYYLSTLEVGSRQPEQMLALIRQYWDIEGGLHQRLDVTAREDASRVRNRNAILVLGILRRSMIGHFYRWRRKKKNKRQSTLQDFYDANNAFNNRLAFQSLKPRLR